MGTRNKGWQTAIAPVAAKFQMASVFGVNVTMNVNAKEIAILMSEMAQRLDLATDLITMKDTQIGILERQVKILSEDVTLECNNV